MEDGGEGGALCEQGLPGTKLNKDLELIQKKKENTKSQYYMYPINFYRIYQRSYFSYINHGRRTDRCRSHEGRAGT